MTPLPLNHEDAVALQRIQEIIPGYSGFVHQGFFKMLLAQPNVNNLLILGVYHARDIAIILDLARRWRRERPLFVWGVDKFTDTACADWPEDKKSMTWGEAGFGSPPSTVLGVKQNIYRAVGPLPGWMDYNIVQADDAEFLEMHAEKPLKFDVVYLDTSHDEQTVKRQLAQVPKVLHPGGIICGDDYSDDSNAGGNWGVKKAVTEIHPKHTVFGNWIWMVEPQQT